MRAPSTDIFGPVEENNDENIEEEVEEEEEEEEEEPEEEEEKEEDTSSSEEEGEADDDDEPDPWSPLRQKVGGRSQRNLPERSPTVPGLGKIPTLCRKCRFQCPITCK